MELEGGMTYESEECALNEFLGGKRDRHGHEGVAWCFQGASWIDVGDFDLLEIGEEITHELLEILLFCGVDFL